jgi:hypothetical protein
MKQKVFCVFFSLLSLFAFSVEVLSFDASEDVKSLANLNYDGVAVLIDAVSFNAVDDWVELVVLDAGFGDELNLKGFYFKDDGVLKTIEQDFWVSVGESFFVRFNSEEIDKEPNLFVKKKGLVATSEQLMVFSPDGRLVDAVCWVNDKPTETEIKDFEFLREVGAWAGDDIFSCLPSKNAKKDFAVQRRDLNDTDSLNDWILLPPEKIEPVSLSGDKSANNLNSKVELALDESFLSDAVSETNSSIIEGNSILPVPELVLDESFDLKAVNSKAVNSKVVALDFSDASIEENLFGVLISELLPNPESVDKGKEWIEVANYGDEGVDIGGFRLRSLKKPKEVFVFPKKVLQPREVFTVSDAESGLALNNTFDEVYLFNAAGVLIDKVAYESAIDGNSWARFVTDERQGERSALWQWTQNLSFGQFNGIFRRYEGRVDSVVEDFSFVEVKVDSGEVLKFLMDADFVDLDLAKLVLRVGNLVDFVIGENNEGLYVESFELLEEAELELGDFYLIVWACILFLILIVAFVEWRYGLFYLRFKNFFYDD